MALDLHGFLNPNDTVAISFWIISISMVASTVFLLDGVHGYFFGYLMGGVAVEGHWKTSMNVGAFVTLVAAVILLPFPSGSSPSPWWLPQCSS